MKYFTQALRFIIFMTVLLGLIYPLIMTGMSQVLFPRESNGNLINQNDKIIGSKLIGQNFEKSIYFWSRPSAINYNPLPSGGTNLSQTSAVLKKSYEERKSKLQMAHPDQTIDPPQDLLFASGSGLDPHMSYEAAIYQHLRVAKARDLSAAQVLKLIDSVTESRQFGILGEKTVNVLMLNLALDQN